MGPAQRRVAATHIAAATGTAAAIAIAFPPAAIVLAPLGVFWWRKAARDATRARLKDEMDRDRVSERLNSANRADIAAWNANRRSSARFGVLRSETRSDTHPIFRVTASYTISSAERSEG